MKRTLALAAAAALAAGCIEAPPSGNATDAAPGDVADAARVDTAVTYYMARGGRMNTEDRDGLAIIGERGDGRHLGVFVPSSETGLESSLQEANWFELGTQRATDAAFGEGGLLVAGQGGRVTVVPPGLAPLVFELSPIVESPRVAVASFPTDPRLMVAAADRLWMQEAVGEGSVEISLVGSTFRDPVFIDVLLRPQDKPIDDIPFLGVADGKDLGLYEIVAGVPPQLGADQAGTAELTAPPARAFWRHVEGTAQAFSFATGSNLIHWFRVGFDGTDPVLADFEVTAVTAILDLMIVQLDTGQNEIVILGHREGDLVVVAYLESVGFGGLQLANGMREWVAPDDLTEAPVMTAADMAVDLVPGGDEIVLVEASGRVRCLDVTDTELIESCDSVDLSAPSTSGRPGL